MNSSFLIHDKFGEPLRPDLYSYRLKTYLTKHDIEHITLHELRHTHATMLNYFGKDLVEISDQMRHAQLSTTLDVYTHMFEDSTQSSKNIAVDFDNYYNKVDAN
jgi:integrase